MKKSKKYLVAFIVALLFSIPLYSKYITGFTVDLSYHLTRIEGIKDALQAHTFPIYIYPYANNGFGYAAPLFYPDLFMLIPAFFYCLGVPILLSYKIFLFVVTYFTALFAYILFDRIFKDDKLLPIVCTLLYCFSDFRIALIFQASTLGNAMGMVFIPLLFLSFYKFFIERENCYILIGISFTLLLLSHVLSFTLAVIFFGIFLIIDVIINHFKKERIICVFKAMVVAILLSAFFLFPMIEQMLSQKFWYSFLRDTTNKNMLMNSRYDLKTLFSGFVVDYVITGTSENVNRYLGIHLSLGSVLAYLYLFFNKKTNKTINVLFIVLMLCLFIQLSAIPIDLLKPFYTIQFLWRIDAFLVPIAIYIIAYFCSLQNKKIFSYLMILYLVINVSLHYCELYPSDGTLNNFSNYYEFIEQGKDEKMLGQTHNINFFELVSGEYLPYTNSYDYYHANTNIEFANEESAIWDFERLGTTLTFSTNYDYSDYIYMPLSWYKGYYYQELDNSGNVLYEKECTYDIYTKRVGMYMEEGEHNYKVFYKGTIVQKLTLVVSLTSTTVLIFKLLQYKKNKYV